MESKNQIKILSFHNCELYCCHLDGYKGEREVFRQRLISIENTFMEKPATARFRIWYNVDGTMLDSILIREITASVVRMQSHIIKIAFIGLGFMQWWHLNRILKSETGNQSLFYAHFADAEKAKEWLV